jgi:hypothetical protein
VKKFPRTFRPHFVLARQGECFWIVLLLLLACFASLKVDGDTTGYSDRGSSTQSAPGHTSKPSRGAGAAAGAGQASAASAAGAAAAAQQMPAQSAEAAEIRSDDVSTMENTSQGTLQALTGGNSDSAASVASNGPVSSSSLSPQQLSSEITTDDGALNGKLDTLITQTAPLPPSDAGSADSSSSTAVKSADDPDPDNSAVNAAVPAAKTQSVPLIIANQGPAPDPVEASIIQATPSEKEMPTIRANSGEPPAPVNNGSYQVTDDLNTDTTSMGPTANGNLVINPDNSVLPTPATPLIIANQGPPPDPINGAILQAAQPPKPLPTIRANSGETPAPVNNGSYQVIDDLNTDNTTSIIPPNPDDANGLLSTPQELNLNPPSQGGASSQLADSAQNNSQGGFYLGYPSSSNFSSYVTWSSTAGSTVSIAPAVAIISYPSPQHNPAIPPRSSSFPETPGTLPVVGVPVGAPAPASTNLPPRIRPLGIPKRDPLPADPGQAQREEEINALLTSGQRLEAEKQYHQASIAFTKAWRLEPANENSALRAAKSLSQDKNEGGAASLLEKLNAIDSKLKLKPIIARLQAISALRRQYAVETGQMNALRERSHHPSMSEEFLGKTL